MDKSNTFEQSAAQVRQASAFTHVQEHHLLTQNELEEEFQVDSLRRDFEDDEINPHAVTRMLLARWYADCQAQGRAVRQNHCELLSVLHSMVKRQDWDDIEAVCGGDYEYGYHPATESLIVVRSHYTLIVSSHEESHGAVTIGKKSLEERLFRNPDLQPLI